MPSNELAMRFTEGKYATKSEVGKELKMSMFDNIWSNILSYRSGYNRYLSIKSIEKNQLVVCFCPSVNALVNSADMKLIRLMKESSRLSVTNGEVNRFEDECLIRSLRYVAAEHECDASDNYLRSLIHGDIREVSPNVRILSRYLDALNYVKKYHVNTIDVDFLAEIYARLMGTSELTSFYRTTEDVNRENRVLIDRIYTAAPVYLIEGMMDSLFTFISTSTLSAATKASIAYYYINYIRPFSTFSDEVALLIAKAILAHDGLSELGVLLPLESLLSEGQEEITRLFVEVQKTCDTTYFVNFALKQMEAKCDDLFNYIAQMKAASLRADFYKEDRTVQPQGPAIQQSLFEAANEPEPAPAPRPVYQQAPVEPAPAPVQEAPVQPAQVVEQPKPVVEQPKVEEPKPAPQPVIEEQPVSQTEQIAVSYIPPAIDEKQALRLEQHLLELDPSLRKHEAHFYARHCTLGKSYTIAQYKRMIGCVYETARTAMDHLVELGYYRKDSSNKKFIYTPIPRK
ncbi:MAG: hypothetical protein J5511_05195 [Bacilli bacterium]|nr:hypothetical protein [Bacilli bacterium]